MKKNISSTLLLAINYYSAIYVILGVTIPYLYGYSSISLLVFIALWIYLLPPLLCRIYITLFGRPVGTVKSNSRVFFNWWFLTQLQVVFVRFPFLEELLRIFPGVYNLWINLWGGKVSLLAYWSPGVTVTDRYHINIGRHTIIGGGCRIGGHLISVDEEGDQCLIVAPLKIEEGCVIGFHAAIGPGSHVYAKETIPANKILKPFYTWKDGKVQRPDKES